MCGRARVAYADTEDLVSVFEVLSSSANTLTCSASLSLIGPGGGVRRAVQAAGQWELTAVFDAGSRGEQDLGARMRTKKLLYCNWPQGGARRSRSDLLLLFCDVLLSNHVTVVFMTWCEAGLCSLKCFKHLSRCLVGGAKGRCTLIFFVVFIDVVSPRLRFPLIQKLISYLWICSECKEDCFYSNLTHVSFSTFL